MHKEAREELDVRFKLVVLELVDHFGVRKTCEEFNDIFYCRVCTFS